MCELAIPGLDLIARRFLTVTDLASKLRPQSFEVLQALMRAPGEIVSKVQLFQQVWGRRAVTDDSLVQCIKEIRQALGDSKHQILQTVHRRGYRISLDQAELAESCVLPRLAVLPVHIDSIEHQELVVASRLLCGVNTKLAGHSDFSVSSRLAMNSIRDEGLSVRQMSDRLGVQYFLAGELRRTAGTLHWFFELINARKDRVLWSESGVLAEADLNEKIESLVCETARQIILALVDDWRCATMPTQGIPK